jgi:hypothetical protein
MGQNVALCTFNQKCLEAAPYKVGPLLPEEYVLQEVPQLFPQSRSS